VRTISTRGSFFLLVFLPIFAPRLIAQQASPPVMQSAYGERIRIAGIPNAGKINDHLYRGAQPSPPAFSELKKLGVTTVVDLRRESDSSTQAEQKAVEAQGLRFMAIPIGGFSAPTNDQVVTFLAIFRDHPQEKVFVHCQYGEDRTGVFIASYRMTFEHWTSTQALNEMNNFGFHRHWQREMQSFVRDFPSRMNAAPVLAQFAKTRDAPSAQMPAH
jgi:tyrosine-protein phosphatase SIW14